MTLLPGVPILLAKGGRGGKGNKAMPTGPLAGRDLHLSTSQLNLSRFVHQNPATAQLIPHKTLTSSPKVDECKPMLLVNFTAQPDPFPSLKPFLQAPNVSYINCSREDKKWTSVRPCWPVRATRARRVRS